MLDEIKKEAQRHLAVDGANLSLRAVARDLGMVSSAVYRYFPSRDELLTALIIDAYDALGESAERAEASVPRSDLTGRWLASCRGVRSWARAHPHEYALLYGTPVPGYAAPEVTVGPASRPVLLIAAILRDGVRRGIVQVQRSERLPRAVRDDLAQIAEQEAFADIPEAVLARGITAWIHLFGALNFEMFSRLDGVIDDRDAFFDHQMRVVARMLGITEARR
jgi:AcrR family transcriptional regulator